MQTLTLRSGPASAAGIRFARRQPTYTFPVNSAIHGITTPFDQGGTVFLYLVKGDRIALVDTGVQDSPRNVLEPALAELGMRLADIDLILNTHAHLDHTGGNLEAKRASRAKIYLHSADLPMAESNEVQVEFHTAPLREAGLPPEFIEQRAQQVRKHSGDPAPVDVLLADGQAVDLGAGVKLTAVHCPGHTPGHLSFYWDTEGILITGDAVQGQGSRPGAYPYYFDAVSYRGSISKLAGMGARTVCLGHAFHGGTVINEPVRTGEEVNLFFREAIRAADAMHNAVAETLRQRPGATVGEVVQVALDYLVYEIPQQRLRLTGLTTHCVPALVSHYRAALAGTYPI